MLIKEKENLVLKQVLVSTLSSDFSFFKGFCLCSGSQFQDERVLRPLKTNSVNPSIHVMKFIVSSITKVWHRNRLCTSLYSYPDFFFSFKWLFQQGSQNGLGKTVVISRNLKLNWRREIFRKTFRIKFNWYEYFFRQKDKRTV